MQAQLKKFIESIGADSVAIIPAAHEATRSYDTEYKFRQDSDFAYLTGFPEPDAIAVIEPANKKPYTLYVRPAIRLWKHGSAAAKALKER